MGLKINNSYYSNREITPVLQRKGFIIQKMEGYKGLRCLVGSLTPEEPTKILDAYEVFRQIVNKRLHQTKQQFLDSL